MAKSRREFLSTLGAGTAAATLLGGISTSASAQIKSDDLSKVPTTVPNVNMKKPPIPTRMLEVDLISGHVKRRDLKERQVGPDLAIFDPETSQVHILNPMAATVWQHVRPDRNVDGVFDMYYLYYRETGVSKKQVRADVVQTLASFRKMGLMVPHNATDKVGKGATRMPTMTITEKSLNTYRSGYMGPAMKSYSPGQLSEIANSYKNAAFLDVWNEL